tara:strand:+ start:114 stop:242 length:129 start_codon:yes stop_codon:yes gene_type:complete
MNKEIIQAKLDYSTSLDSYRMLFKGIWTGVLISLIVHQMLGH